MIYFKINNIDLSNRVNALNVTKNATYNAQVNAAGNTVIDYINTKRKLQVGFITMPLTQAQSIFALLENLVITISYLDAKTNKLETINCYCPTIAHNYFTIQDAKQMVNSFTLEFTEL